jgi:uncharacterized protein (UPF0335 family)
MRQILIARSSHDLQIKIKQLMQQYHPLGYDTKVIQTYTDPDTKDYVAVITRLDSCD